MAKGFLRRNRRENVLITTYECCNCGDPRFIVFEPRGSGQRTIYQYFATEEGKVATVEAQQVWTKGRYSVICTNCYETNYVPNI